MKCLCPKCNATIELDSVEISAEGRFDKCPACDSDILIRKVSFAKRALYRSDDITCAECGNPPGSSIYCQNCYALYPDYYCAESTSATKKQFGKFLSLFNRINRITLRAPAEKHHHDYGLSPELVSAGTKPVGNRAKLAAILVIILLVLGTGGYFWYQGNIESAYAGNYVRTVATMKSTADFDIKTCNRIITDWKNSSAPSSPKLAAAELTTMSRANTDVETLMKRIGPAPEKFMTSSDALVKLYDSYTKLHTFATSPAGNLDAFTATARKLEDEFRKNSRDLKAGLPDKIASTLQESKQRYKPLQDL